MSNAEIIAQGTEAWQQEKAHRRMSWPNWKRIGLALEVIRSEAMAEAGCNTPFGKRYTHAAARRLDGAGLADIPQQVRSRLMKCMEHLPAIEKWLSSLSEEERGRIGHPDSIWMHFSSHSVPQRSGPRPRQQHVVLHQDRRHDRRTDGGEYLQRPERPEQDLIRRVAEAMRKSGRAAPGSDVVGLASVAIETLTVEDHLALAGAKAPRADRGIAPAAIELHA